MPVGILLIFVMLASSLVFLSVPKRQIDNFKEQSSGYDGSNGVFLDNRGRSERFAVGNNRQDADKSKRESIETALIRTCRAVSTIAHANGCTDWNKASSVWKFVGNIGEVKSLDAAVTGSTTAVFSCLRMDQYGRGLLQQSIPKAYVANLGYLYDFTSMEDDNSDPCGYIDIVRE